MNLNQCVNLQVRLQLSGNGDQQAQRTSTKCMQLHFWTQEVIRLKERKHMNETNVKDANSCDGAALAQQLSEIFEVFNVAYKN